MKDFLSEIISNPLTIVVILIILLVYFGAAKGSKKLPHIPLGLFILYFILDLVRMGLDYSGLPSWAGKFYLAQIIVIYCAAAQLIFYILVDVWLTRRRKAPVPRITRDVSLALIFVIIAFIVLHKMGGVNLASLLTTSAVLTMVIGLALQDTLGNLFSGLALQTEKLFEIGEWISFREHVGQVVGMTWKSTLIRTLEHEMVYIPNNVVSKEIVKNYSRPETRHVAYIEIGIEYGAPPNKVRGVILDTLAEHPRVLKHPPPQVRLMSFGDFAITYQIRFWNEDFENEKFLKSEIMNNLWYALKRNGIQIPFPIRDVHLHHVERMEEKRARQEFAEGIKKILRKIPVLEPLSGEDIDLLSKRVAIERYGGGESIVHQDELGESMYLIHHGCCDVVLEIDERKTIATLGEGDFFGEMSLLTGERRTASVVAKGDVEVIRIDKCAFAEIMSAHPQISDALGEALSKRQAELASLQGKGAEVPAASVTKQLVSRIKSFFGIG